MTTNTTGKPQASDVEQYVYTAQHDTSWPTVVFIQEWSVCL